MITNFWFYIFSVWSIVKIYVMIRYRQFSQLITLKIEVKNEKY